eukprot:m.446114 g.446114  ORF g.446114 m.446114 type:complete len:394 (+) comp20307_c4_seq3:1732-2913(+)
MANKKALLVGCNYPGTNAALRGCVNDVFSMKKLLVQHKGFPESNITLMIDTDSRYERPTGAAVKRALNQLIASSNAGDILFFHFSGHGTQVPADASDTEELDGKDEAICPTDLNIIVDDDLRDIVEKLPADVELTFIADCCHSGGLLDHTALIITGGSSGGAGGAGPSLMDLMGAVTGDGGAHGRDFKPRELPLDMLCQMLTQQSGKRVAPGNIRQSLGGIFGADASKIAMGALSMLQGRLAGGAGGAGQRSSMGMVARMLPVLLSCMRRQQGGDPGGAPPPEQFQIRPPGTKPPPNQQLAEEKGVLISGCQSHETSADACPGGDASKAYGALTNAICTLVNKSPEINYYDLVYNVRLYLKQGGFSQNPGLECSHSNSEKPFICNTTSNFADL